MKKNQPIEILIIVILAIILLSYIAVTYLIKPVISETEAINDRIFQKEAAIKTTYFTVSSYQAKSESLQKLTSALVPYSEKFYSLENEADYLENINVQVKDCEVGFVSLAALEEPFKVTGAENTEAICKAISEDKNLRKSSQMSKERYDAYFEQLRADEGRFGSDVRTETLTVEATGDYLGIMAFLEKLTSNDKNVLCNSLTFDIAENISLRASADPAVRIVISLTFIRIPEIASMCDIPVPEPLPVYNFPQSIIDGTYRTSGGLLSGIGA